MAEEKENQNTRVVSPISSDFSQHPVVLAQQELYKKNAELDSLNELLSLARQLYQISLLALDPTALAEKISVAMRDNMHLEMSGIFIFNREKDLLTPLAFAKSERMISAIRKAGFLFKDIEIRNATKRPAFQKMFDGQTYTTQNLGDIWSGLVEDKMLAELANTANIKTVIIHPLLTEERVIGVMILGLTSTYNQIWMTKEESLKSFADVIAVALDKSYTYSELGESNKRMQDLYAKMVDQNKQLKTIDETKSNILSFASHHLQNPMENVVMGTSMIADGSFGAISPEVKNAAVKTFESARHLSLTIKLWLKALEFEENKITYSMKKFDLLDVVNSLSKDWTMVATTRGIAFTIETDNKSPYNIVADQAWIRDVIMNLTDNAFKMTEKGFIKIKVEKIGIEKTRLSVIDSGVGIDTETLPKLFTKFERGDEGYKKDIEGTGLGLYISKKIIEDGHHGRIWAESVGHEKGATFSIELDLI